MSQKGFWDKQEIVSKLKNKKPVLICLSESIPWEAFHPLLENGYNDLVVILTSASPTVIGSI